MFKNVPEGGGFTIFRNGGAYDGNETAVHQYELNSQVGAFEYLYESLHSDVLFQPEVQVVNPHPSIPQGKYLFPRDYFLTMEGEKLMRMEKEEFVKYGKVLIKKKDITNFTLVGGLFGRDMVRLTLALDFDGSESESDCTVYVTETVSGGTAGKNKQGMDLFRAAVAANRSNLS